MSVIAGSTPASPTFLNRSLPEAVIQMFQMESERTDKCEVGSKVRWEMSNRLDQQQWHRKDKGRCVRITGAWA